MTDQLRQDLRVRIDHTGEDDAGHPWTSSARQIYRRLRRELLAVESTELSRLHRDGAIDETTRRSLQRALDLEEARLGDQE
ncbi:MAG: hypothetical protein JOZ47_02370 [Kutzneria sp.]|nr:hypothetical protein [Kutzneria sp.]